MVIGVVCQVGVACLRSATTLHSQLLLLLLSFMKVATQHHL